MDYMGIMATLALLPDDLLAASMTYVRNSWGNKADKITPEMVAAAREKFKDFNDPLGVKRDEIDSIVSAAQ